MNKITSTEVTPKRKKQKGMQLTAPQNSCKIQFNDIIIFIVERKMGVTRRKFLMDLARRKGFRVENELRYEKKESPICYILCMQKLSLTAFS